MTAFRLYYQAIDLTFTCFHFIIIKSDRLFEADICKEKAILDNTTNQFRYSKKQRVPRVNIDRAMAGAHFGRVPQIANSAWHSGYSVWLLRKRR
jgi:hypothetical protein